MITVIAGINGAGKSSVIGEYIRAEGGEYYNADEEARLLIENDKMSLSEANGTAWKKGFLHLTDAIQMNKNYTFETTLGGNSITEALKSAAENGIEIRLIYCGLKSVEQHIERVAARVKKKGHDIPDAKIKDRWKRSINNLNILIPHLHSLRVIDNSASLNESVLPQPKTLFELKDKKFKLVNGDTNMPNWAKVVAMTVRKTFGT